MIRVSCALVLLALALLVAMALRMNAVTVLACWLVGQSALAAAIVLFVGAEIRRAPGTGAGHAERGSDWRRRPDSNRG